jgi:hypothetical protein
MGRILQQLPKDGEQVGFVAYPLEQGGILVGWKQIRPQQVQLRKRVFANMTKENLNAIKRRLISKAQTHTAKNSAHRTDMSKYGRIPNSATKSLS